MTESRFRFRFISLLLCVCAGGILPLHFALALESLPNSHRNANELPGTPLIALIIDDLGNQRLPGLRAVELDGPVACAIMPHTTHATFLAEQAHAAGKEVILHFPMQPVEMRRSAGPGEISLDTSQADLAYILDQNLRSVPHTAGISNHMGSLITRHPGHMRWLMEEMATRGDLFFLDSFTTPDSVALEIALQNGIPAARRHIFLDNEQTTEALEKEFTRLKRVARAQGYAIGIGHPYPVTLEYLQTELPLLESEGFQLVTVSRLIESLNSSTPGSDSLSGVMSNRTDH